MRKAHVTRFGLGVGMLAFGAVVWHVHVSVVQPKYLPDQHVRNLVKDITVDQIDHLDFLKYDEREFTKYYQAALVRKVYDRMLIAQYLQAVKHADYYVPTDGFGIRAETLVIQLKPTAHHVNEPISIPYIAASNSLGPEFKQAQEALSRYDAAIQSADASH